MADRRRRPGGGDRHPGPGLAVLAGAGGGPQAGEKEWACFHVGLLQLAARAIDAHTHEGDGLCRRCGGPWPCELARQAEFLLGAL
jgi:hypothetical protein